MQTYYVSPEGNDYNDGKENTPFRTVSRALSVAGGNSELILNPYLHTGCFIFHKSYD